MMILRLLIWMMVVVCSANHRGAESIDVPSSYAAATVSHRSAAHMEIVLFPTPFKKPRLKLTGAYAILFLGGKQSPQIGVSFLQNFVQDFLSHSGSFLESFLKSLYSKHSNTNGMQD